MTAPDLTLFYAPGTCGRVPLIALEEAGAAFDVSVVAFMAGEHRRPEYLALNPAGKVPVLRVGDVPLSQNTAILTYLARRFPESGLLPFTGDLLGDAVLLARLAWFAADLHPIVTRIRMPQFACDLLGAPERVRVMASEAMAFQLREAEAALADAPWLLGERWSVLDVYLFWVWFRITGGGFDPTPFPAIAAHHERMKARPAVVRALAREEESFAALAARDLAVPLS